MARGQVKVERLEKPGLEALQMRLRSGGPYHVLHFVGHGAFDEQNQDGLLVFEDANGAAQMVNGQRLGTILHNHPSLRLAVLNACEGGRTSQEDPFAGVAHSLVQQGLPAVIAMQYPITDGAALTFAREFYAALADGFSLDAALAEARVAIFASGNDIEWGTPILFMRSPEQNLFDFEKASSSGKPTAGQAPPKASRGRTQWSRWGGFALLLGLLVVVLSHWPAETGDLPAHLYTDLIEPFSNFYLHLHLDPLSPPGLLHCQNRPAQPRLRLLQRKPSHPPPAQQRRFPRHQHPP